MTDILRTIASAIGIGKWVNKLLSPTPEVRYVHMKYPEDSGLSEDFAAKGYNLSWCDERKLQFLLDKNEAKHIFTPPGESKPVVLKVKSNPRDLVLIYKPKT